VIAIGHKALENLESSLECLFFFDHPNMNGKKEFTPFLDFKIYISMLTLDIQLSLHDLTPEDALASLKTLYHEVTQL
jgi:hypothetical protein